MARAKDDKATMKSLRRDLESYARKDAEDHGKLYLAIDGVKKDVEGVSQKVEGMEGHLTTITGILEEERDIRATERADKLSSHKFRRQLIMKVVAIVTPIVAALAAGITHWLHIRGG